MKFFLLSILMLSALINLCSGDVPPVSLEAATVYVTEMLGEGARRIIDLYF